MDAGIRVTAVVGPTPGLTEEKTNEALAALAHAGNPVQSVQFLPHAEGQAAGFVAFIVYEDRQARREADAEAEALRRANVGRLAADQAERRRGTMGDG